MGVFLGGRGGRSVLTTLLVVMRWCCGGPDAVNVCGWTEGVLALVSCPVMPEKARYVDSPC
jgi:hypothetical protein